jgi:hypothetical protein
MQEERRSPRGDVSEWRHRLRGLRERIQAAWETFRRSLHEGAEARATEREVSTRRRPGTTYETPRQGPPAHGGASAPGRGQPGAGAGGEYRAGTLAQSFTGRGPRGYRRSDERIREELCDVLTEHPEIDASDIEVTVQHGEVTLSGMVEDRAAKHMAEQMAEEISGVDQVHNQLRVRTGGAASPGTHPGEPPHRDS